MKGESVKRFCISSIAAGIAIGIGGTAYLVTGYAWMFPIGLLIVCCYSLRLYTGRICYWNYKWSSLKYLLAIWLLNSASAYILGRVIGWCKPDLVEKAALMVDKKLSEGLMLIPLAILCNVLIFVAVDGYGLVDRAFLSIVKLIFATMVFVYCGFEHCIANSFYFGVAGVWNMGMIRFLIQNMFWNSIGGLLAAVLIGDREGWRPW